jgi:hypothetical protein
MMLFVGIAIVVVAVIGTLGCFATVMYVLAKEGRLPAIWRKSAETPIRSTVLVSLYSQGANAMDSRLRDVNDAAFASFLSEVNRPEQVVNNQGFVLDAEKITALPRQPTSNLLEYAICQ